MIVRGEFFPLLRALTLAIFVHALMVLLVVLGTYEWKPFRQPQPVGLTIEAVIVDTSEIRGNARGMIDTVEIVGPDGRQWPIGAESRR